MLPAREENAGEKLRLTSFGETPEELELLQAAMSNVTSGVTVADARNPDLPLVFVNRGFEIITGYQADEVIGRSCRFLQGKERDQSGLRVLRKALKAGEPCVVRLRNFRKDGKPFYNELRISPVRNLQGELTHFVGIQLDVTERVHAREALEHSERQTRQALEKEAELNEIKTRFISMVSHEFRTPMTGIQSSATLIRKFGEKLGPEKIERHWENIHSSLKRMNRLLDDVLFFSQAAADKVDVMCEQIQLDRYFDGLVESLSSVFPDRTILLQSSLPKEASYSLDAHLLDHIFHNLIGNALKYSTPESVVHVVLARKGEQLLIRVVDTGIGIPEADWSHLFEAFHRAENVGNRKGTGLGLTIARRAVELLGGKLEFSSIQGKGTTFTVVLPVL